MVAPAVAVEMVRENGAEKIPRFTLNWVSATFPNSEYAPLSQPGVASLLPKKAGVWVTSGVVPVKRSP